MQMPGRTYTASFGYRYSINGQEKTPEIAPNTYTAMYWEYDSRIGRRWNVDPAGKIWESPYSVFGANPIRNVDPLGNDWYQKGDKFEWYKGSGKRDGYTNVGKFHKYVSVNNTIVTLWELNGKFESHGWDEEKGKDKYEKSILKGHNVYTSNYGWVDLTHAFKTSSRENIGSENLWKNICLEGGEGCGNAPTGYYNITYTQDANVFGVKSGVSKKYRVKQNLSIDERREVAVAIMQDVTKDFESKQRLAFWSSSSYEISDLPSNMLGLYKVMFNMTREEITKLINPLTKLQSIDVYRSESDNPFKQKNYSFKPVLFPNKYSPYNAQIPAFFNSVTPMKIGSNILQVANESGLKEGTVIK